MCAVPVAAQDLDEEIKYSARDSIRYDLQQQIVFLFGAARVVYGDIELTADRIEYRFKAEEARAFGAPDSTGAVAGKPVFIESDHRIEADSIRYNFRSKKGLIKEVRTSEQESYVQARVSKRHANGEVHSKGGTFTTCDRPHPHYYFRASRMMVIPDDKIVSGAAVMKIGPVPTPLVLPFGFFPNKKNGSAGILFPAYGDGGPLGYFLQNGGYYMPLGERADMQLTGDIYTRGSWALKALARYKVRYRYGGSLNLSFNNRRNSIPELPDFQRTRDFFLTWTHAVDSRASLTDRFNASVNVGTSTNFQNNFNSSTLNFLSNTFNSNIGWNHLWPSKPYSLAVNLRHSQNSSTRNFDFTLPLAHLQPEPHRPLPTQSGAREVVRADRHHLHHQLRQCAEHHRGPALVRQCRCALAPHAQRGEARHHPQHLVQEQVLYPEPRARGHRAVVLPFPSSDVRQWRRSGRAGHHPHLPPQWGLARGIAAHQQALRHVPVPRGTLEGHSPCDHAHRQPGLSARLRSTAGRLFAERFHREHLQPLRWFHLWRIACG
ncbi:MAG: LPS-assembly protein LptD [Flavobacteriales bacterium]|nr:LPS-assembly protein LptD [Flavobacteriales bacterium]